jgi:crossover junction endodeoxyribonuclease RuvC
VRVVGIDPGSRITGWGVVERSARGIRYLASGTINTRGCGSFPARLKRIHEGVRSVLRRWCPQAVGLEGVFVSRNVQAAFRLGEARGAAIVGVAGEGIDVFEYTPAAVKLAVAGSGRADKEQVGRGVARLLGIDEDTLCRDASDALAVAVCHLHTTRFSGRLAAGVVGAGAGSSQRQAATGRRRRADEVRPTRTQGTVVREVPTHRRRTRRNRR